MNRDSILIEADELLTKLDDKNIRLYDANMVFNKKEDEASAYEKYLQGHIPGAAFFEHQDFSDSSNHYPFMVLPEKELAEQIGSIGISEKTPVIFYSAGILPCATRAWWLLRYAGHDNVRVLNGGLAAWKKAGGQLESEARQYEAATFNCRLRPRMFSNKEEVSAALGDDTVCVVNTLSLESHEGAHITGSSCLPCGDLMHESASFLSNDQMASRLKQEAQHNHIITYCGGGIAATTNALAHIMTGNEKVSVYDGSMAEWVGEGLPTTKGGQTTGGQS